MLSSSAMRTFVVAATGLLSLILSACSTPEDSSGGDGDATLPPLARAFEGNPYPSAIAAGSGGDVFFTGTFSYKASFGGAALPVEPDGSVFLAHLDAGGEHLFSGSTGSGDLTHDVAIGPLGELYVVGEFDGNINFGSGMMAGDDDAVFAAFKKGAPDRSFSVSTDHPDALTNVAVTPAGVVVVAGRLGHDADLGAGAPDDGTGMRTTLAAYDRDGKHLWEQRLPDAFVNGFEIATDPAGNIFLAGDTYLSFSIGDLPVPKGLVVVKMAPSGEPLWVQSTVGGVDAARFQALAVDERGDIAIAALQREDLAFGGVAVPYPGGDYGGLMARLSADGEVKLVKSSRIDGNIAWMEVGASKGGDTILVVNTVATVDFGTGPKGAPETGGWSAVIARWDAAGTLLEADPLPGTGPEKVFGVAMVGDSPVLLGTFTGEVTIGEETLSSPNGTSLFVGRLDR